MPRRCRFLPAQIGLVEPGVGDPGIRPGSPGGVVGIEPRRRGRDRRSAYAVLLQPSEGTQPALADGVEGAVGQPAAIKVLGGRLLLQGSTLTKGRSSTPRCLQLLLLQKVLPVHIELLIRPVGNAGPIRRGCHPGLGKILVRLLGVLVLQVVVELRLPAGLVGKDIGTQLISQMAPLAARKQWMLDHLQTLGQVVLDAGAVQKLTREGKSLLPIGVLDVRGEFSRGAVVTCCDEAGKAIARGLSNYSSADARRIKRHASAEIASILGFVEEPELIHRDNLVLL